MGYSGPTPDEAGYSLRQQRERAAGQLGHSGGGAAALKLLLFCFAVSVVLAYAKSETNGTTPAEEYQAMLAAMWSGLVDALSRAVSAVVDSF